MLHCRKADILWYFRFVACCEHLLRAIDRTLVGPYSLGLVVVDYPHHHCNSLLVDTHTVCRSHPRNHHRRWFHPVVLRRNLPIAVTHSMEPAMVVRFWLRRGVVSSGVGGLSPLSIEMAPAPREINIYRVNIALACSVLVCVTLNVPMGARTQFFL